ncbi:MAG: glycosyltransferase [Planctomycetota bacterium]
MPIRICHISTVHHAEDVRIVERECGTLAQRGYLVHLVISGPLPANLSDKLIVHSVPRFKPRLIRILLAPGIAMMVALRTKADIFHLHDPELLPVGFIMRWVLGRRVVYDIHEAVSKQILGKDWLPRWCRPLAAMCYRMVENVCSRGMAIVLANENCVEDYRRRRTYLVRNFPLLPNSKDGGPATAGCENKLTQAWTRHPPKRKPDLLVYVGGVSRDRGGEVYVELARRLKEKGREFELAIVGPCHPKYQLLLEKKIEAHGLRDTVRLVGRLPHREAMSLVSEASIGLCLLLPIPNYTTCLATKILEYMMCGTAVLASNFDAWKLYVDGERSGLMADPTNIDAVVLTCERMLDDGDELRAMAERGRKAVVERLNWEAEDRVLEQCYHELMA